MAVQLADIVSPLIWFVTRLLREATELKKVFREDVKVVMFEL